MPEIFHDIHGNEYEKPEDVAAGWRLSAYSIVVSDKDEILTIKPQVKNKTWELPGGSVEENENPRDAAVRETYEETGYKIEIPTTTPIVIVDNFYLTKKKKYVRVVRLFFNAHLEHPGQNKNAVNRLEVSEIGWRPLTKLKKANWREVSWQTLSVVFDAVNDS